MLFVKCYRSVCVYDSNTINGLVRSFKSYNKIKGLREVRVGLGWLRWNLYRRFKYRKRVKCR